MVITMAKLRIATPPRVAHAKPPGPKNIEFLEINTPGTAGGPGGRDRTLAVAKNRTKMTFFSGGKKNYPKKIFFFCIYLLVMPKYWVKNYFAHGRFPEVGQKQKTEKKKIKKERKTEKW